MDDSERRKVDEQKKLFDAVTKAWLDEKFAVFGRWTFKAILAISFIAILKTLFHLNSHDLRAILETTSTVHDLAN